MLQMTSQANTEESQTVWNPGELLQVRSDNPQTVSIKAASYATIQVDGGHFAKLPEESSGNPIPTNLPVLM